MKLGFFTMPIHPLDKDWRQSLREDREAFLLADKLGFTEGLCRRAFDRQGREHHLLHDVHREPRQRRQAASSSAPARSTCRTSIRPRSPPTSRCSTTCSTAGFIFGISPGGLLSDAEVFGNLDNDRNAMFLEAINTVLAIWDERAALQHQGQVLEHQARAPVLPGDRPGLPAEAAAEAASADRRHRGRAVLQGRHRGRGARLGSDLGELPDAGMGEEPLAEIRRRLRARRPPGRSGELARRQEHLRRRRRQDREGLRRPIRTARTASTTASSTPS